MPISQERMEQLKALAIQIKQNPELKAQVSGQGQQGILPRPKTTMGVLERIGPPYTSGVVSTAASEALKPTPEEIAGEKALQTRESEKAKTLSELEKGGAVSKTNLQLIADSTRDFAQVYADSIKEGGAGGITQSIASGFAEKVGDPSIIGKQFTIGSKYPATTSIIGKKTELLTKMMPMLTQQPTKPEGSVRLVTTIFDKLGLTLPDRGTGIAAGRRQLQETLRSFYRFARAAKLAGKDFDKMFQGQDPLQIPEKALDSWIADVNDISGRLEMSDEEEAAFERMANKALQPIDNILEQQEGGGQSGLTPEEQAEYELLSRKYGGQ